MEKLGMAMKADRQTYTAPYIDLTRFRYDPETGLVHWSRWANIDDPVGQVDHYGYVTLNHEGYRIAVHRLAWRLHHGAWPMHRIDHKDGDKTNNRPGNMREATNGQNGMNRPVQANNACGLKGVARDSRAKVRP